ncbi:hypothetical protein THRCLA_09855 [Thraustotheca clavata]|uniref:Palmitoyltransferase n=1 Tax=Thraustotheca clavata TaxID=74557 RepID=A0A1V9YTW9_9STRA|nr:hypothetical protein THRCLA_09855 [Thraustotheca clavata]
MVEQDDIHVARKKIIYARLWWLLFHGGDYFWLLYSGTWSAYFYHESSSFDVVSCTFVTLIAILNLLVYIKLQCSCPGFVPQSTDNEHSAIESYDTDVLLLEKNMNEAVYDVESGRELHYCDICHIHQPLRAKHCKDCGRCIQHYDHQYVVYFFYGFIQ